MARLFGTDGVRGIANDELTCELAFALGRAAVRVLAKQNKRPRILIGCDTRISGDMLQSALVAGICSTGGMALRAGVIPTPGIAYLVRHMGYDAGVVISASHNPVEYNGIKLFSSEGYKLPDEMEDQIEACINAGFSDLPTGGGLGSCIDFSEGAILYSDYLARMAAEDYSGLRIAIDSANGACSAYAAALFERLGAQVLAIHNQPNGVNINEHCGSTHPEELQALVAERDADIGLAFDGDADRLIACDEKGMIIDGDRIMGLCAMDYRARGKLAGNTLVATVMSNMGLIVAMEREGIAVHQTAVGDRYVLEAMRKNGYNLGGEQSGHVIFSDLSTSGDGMLSALQLVDLMVRGGKPMSELARQIQIMPQVLVNAYVSAEKKNRYAEDSAIVAMMADLEAIYGNGAGRLLIRPSGTEHLIRVMIEGEDLDAMQAHAQSLASLMEEKLQ